MNVKVTVVDYGIGNTFSICNAFHHCGAKVSLSSDSREIRTSDRLVLPGVGAFKDGMEKLKTKNLHEDIIAFKERERPFLGICLGMQLLFSTSEEFGVWEGLNLISGRVKKISTKGKDLLPHKIPHIGWNRVFPPKKDPQAWRDSLLKYIHPEAMVYFVHSFHAVPEDENELLAICDYNGLSVTAAVKKDHIMGCQFHPEKSGQTGLAIFNAFLEL